MDTDKLKAAHEKFDREFSDKHPDFVKWWHNHPDCDPLEKWRVAPRVAWKVRRYYDEFMDSKRYGLPVPSASYRSTQSGFQDKEEVHAES